MNTQNSYPGKIWGMSGGQLLQTWLPAAYVREIEIVLLDGAQKGPSSLIINPYTNEPFISKKNIVVLDKWDDWKPDWMDQRKFDKSGIWTNYLRFIMPTL